MDLAQYFTHHQVPFERVRGPKRAHFDETDAIHVRGRHVAKTVLLRTPDGYVIAILPWAYGLDLAALETLLGTRPIAVATAHEIGNVFPDTIGNLVPPMGSPYGIRTVMDVHLAGNVTMLFPGDETSDDIRVDCEDFERLENPITGWFAVPPTEPASKLAGVR